MKNPIIIIGGGNFETCYKLDSILKKNYDTIPAHTTRDVISFYEVIQKDDPIIILNANLEDGDGISCIKELKNINSSCKIIFFTDEPDILTAIQSLNEGADDYLSLKTNGRHLISIIEKNIYKETATINPTLSQAYQTLNQEIKLLLKQSGIEIFYKHAI